MNSVLTLAGIGPAGSARAPGRDVRHRSGEAGFRTGGGRTRWVRRRAMTERRPRMSDDERRRRDRERKRCARALERVSQFVGKLAHGGNFLVRESVGGQFRYTLADRSGGCIHPAVGEAIIANPAVSLVKEEPGCQMFGTREPQ